MYKYVDKAQNHIRISRCIELFLRIIRNLLKVDNTKSQTSITSNSIITVL